MQNVDNKDEVCAKPEGDPLAEPKHSYYYDDAHGYEEYDPKKDVELDEETEDLED